MVKLVSVFLKSGIIKVLLVAISQVKISKVPKQLEKQKIPVENCMVEDKNHFTT